MVYIPVGDDRLRLYHRQGEPVSVVQCNEKMREPLRKALACLDWVQPSLYPITYHGCYNRRMIAGTNKPSKHAYGMAIDIDVNGRQPTAMVACFEAAGFTWGGRWPGDKKDPHHYQLDY